ncbi:MAG: glycosyltransferase, partial [Ktedonobacterales bacterium]
MQQTDSPATISSTMSPGVAPRGAQTQPAQVAISVVIPVYNEAESVRPLYDALTPQLVSLNLGYEVIFIDDGSRDATFAQLQA